MQVLILARHGKLCEATQDRITARAQRLSRYAKLNSISISVNLHVSDQPHISGHAVTHNLEDLVASHTSESFWGAFDQVLLSLKRQLQKRQDKFVRRRTRSVSKKTEIEFGQDDSAGLILQ